MRVFLVIDETPFFHPNLAKSVIDMLSEDDELVGAGIVVSVPAKSNINRYFLNQIRRLYPSEIVKLGLKKCVSVILDLLFRNGIRGRYYSVAAVMRQYGIPFIKIDGDINKAEIEAAISQFKPDVIISSNSLLFKKHILSLPRFGCINRHSGLLPSYGGILPVFHAIAQGEKETGVTIHKMTTKIDRGEILAQRSTPIKSNDTLWTLYRTCFELSAPAIIDALDAIRECKTVASPTMRNESYFSFPTKEDWEKFRKNGGRWI